MNRFQPMGVGLFLAVLLALTSVWMTAAPAAARTQPQIAPPVAPDAHPIDVVVLLDDSGSMATCWPWPESGQPFSPPCQWPSPNQPSDPDELRYSAAKLLVHLADDNDRVAVVRFDSDAEGVGALGTLQQAGAPENRRRLAASLQPPTNYLIRGYTRLDLGMQEAIRILEGNRQPGRSQYLLLLTDGEPTQPSGAGSQRSRVSQQVDQLRAAGVLVFPVVLCNPSSGCAGEFLRARFDQEVVREATSASALLQVFSEIFAQMKSDRSVVTSRSSSGNIVFRTRDPQGVNEIAFVSPRAGLASVRRGDTPVQTRSLLDDKNVDLNVVDGDLPGGQWVAETNDFSAFAVIRAASYPELVFPPPSALNSPAAVRYYPAGKPPLLIARGVGPAAGESLLLDGQIPFQPLTQDADSPNGLQQLQMATEKSEVTLQLGEDIVPLQLRRTFRLEGRSDLPRVEVLSPRPEDPGILADGRLHMEVGFGPGTPVQGLSATAYVSDETDDEEGRGRPVYEAEMSCVDRTCVDEGFTPGDGRAYRVYYLLTGYAEEIRFGDWAQADLNVDPAVYLRGLPGTIDLGKMPAEGWPVSVIAGTSEEIGSLSATLTLHQAESGDPVPTVGLDFVVDVPESGSQEARLQVTGLDTLRPGDYAGEIRLQATSPAGLPMDVNIRPAPVLPVTLTVARSAARIQAQVADFGEIPFDTSPNFRVDEEIRLPLTFEQGKPFRLNAELVQSSCDGLTVSAGEMQQQDGSTLLPLHLESQAPVQPGGCNGSIRLFGPSEDFDVFPAQLDYQLQILGLEWGIVSGELSFGDVGRAGERATATLLVRFQGKTPFTLQMLEVDVSGSDGDGGIVQLGQDFVDMLPVEVTGEPGEDGLYTVPITLVARKAIPKDAMQGTFYSGDLVLGIKGLETETRTVDINFRSPTAIQRYIEPWLVPIYSLPWLICTGPLTLLLLLILVARVRGRGYVDEEPEPTVTFPQPEPETTFSAPTFVAGETEAGAPGATEGEAAEVGWDSGQWDDVAWGNDQEPSAESPPVGQNGSSDASPWNSSW